MRDTNESLLLSRRFSQRGSIAIACLLILGGLLSCASQPLTQRPTGKPTATTIPSPTIATSPTLPTPMLPGQQIWKNGVSSYLFGTNDTFEWRHQNIETEPAVQDALRSAGFTLIRTFFPDNSTDEEIEQRIQTVENSGSHCLGVITNINNTAFDERLVRYLGGRCLMYEFGNELDIRGFTADAYLARWNTFIPQLRQINPAARFIGPVTYNYQGNHNFMQAFLHGVKASGVLPDAISFHWYPCWNRTETECLARASTAATDTQYVRRLVKSILGYEIPVGITEWNFNPGNPPPAYGDDPNFITQFSVGAVQSMAQGGASFACQFDAASYAGYGHLDMFDVNGQPKAQYQVIKQLIGNYRPSGG